MLLSRQRTTKVLCLYYLQMTLSRFLHGVAHFNFLFKFMSLEILNFHPWSVGTSRSKSSILHYILFFVYFQNFRYRLAILVVTAEGPHCLCSAKWKSAGNRLVRTLVNLVICCN